VALAESYFEAMPTIASRVASRPLPAGLTVVHTPNWELACNNGREPVKWSGAELPGFHIGAIHKEVLAMCCIGPDGGAIGGASEDQFIEDMKACREQPA
jgi:hypothetical protein